MLTLPCANTQAQLSRLNVDDFPEGGREEYRFSESNPFMEDPDPLARGRELFRSVDMRHPSQCLCRWDSAPLPFPSRSVSSHAGCPP